MLVQRRYSYYRHRRHPRENGQASRVRYSPKGNGWSKTFRYTPKNSIYPSSARVFGYVKKRNTQQIQQQLDVCDLFGIS